MKSRNVIRKKTGRPSIGAKAAAVFAMRLPAETAEAVDTFAASESIKSRAEAIRALIEQALALRYRKKSGGTGGHEKN